MRRDAAQTKTTGDSAATFGLASRRKSGRIVINCRYFFARRKRFLAKSSIFRFFLQNFEADVGDEPKDATVF